MTRRELLERLVQIRRNINVITPAYDMMIALIKDVEIDGVLDVQAPEEVAQGMKLHKADVFSAIKTRVDAIPTARQHLTLVLSECFHKDTEFKVMADTILKAAVAAGLPLDELEKAIERF